jgi:cytochrome oxidase Cu insertion factor (SCO1/SenC/PrrC family)
MSVFLILATFLLVACTPSTSTQPAALTHTPGQSIIEKKPTETALEKKPVETASISTPTWYSISLKDVKTGNTFTINGLKGKVILVETMAQWCSNCLQQQKQVKNLHTLLGKRDDFVSVILDVDANENEASLKTYAEKNEFDWIYVISPPEVSRDLSKLYGSQFLNPPSTPMLIIDRKGTAHPLPFGIKGAEDLKKALDPYLNEKP